MFVFGEKNVFTVRDIIDISKSVFNECNYTETEPQKLTSTSLCDYHHLYTEK